MAKQTPDPNFIPATWKGGYAYFPKLISQLVREGRACRAIQVPMLLEILVRAKDQGVKKGQPMNSQMAEWAAGLTMDEFAAVANCSKASAERHVYDLVERKIIARIRAGRSWKYKLTPEFWAEAPPYVPPKVEIDEPAETPANAEYPRTMLAILPGRDSKPLTLGSATLRFRNPSSQRVELAYIEEPDGSFVIELPVNEKPAAVPRPAKAAQAEKHNFADPLESGDYSHEAPHGRGASANPDELEKLLIDEVVPILHTPPPPKIVAQIRTALRNAPLTSLRKRIRVREKVLTDWGLVVGLARDVYEVSKLTGRSHAPPAREAQAPPWDGYGSWAADRHHWAELDDQRRTFYRKAFPDEVSGLERSKGAT
jgi:hypothetical protein